MADGDIRVAKEIMAKMAEEARTNPGTHGVESLLNDGGPGDAHAIATWIASMAYAAGQRCRLVFVRQHGQTTGAIFVEVFHQGMYHGPKAGVPPPEQVSLHPELPGYNWVPVLGHHAWIGEGAEILTWKREVELEL